MCLLICLLAIGCTKDKENQISNMAKPFLVSSEVEEYLRIWINDSMQQPSYFRLRKANGASRMHLVADLPYLFRLSLFATPVFIGSQSINSGYETDLAKKFKHTHFEFFQHENLSIVRYYDIDSTQRLNNRLFITAIDSLQRTISAQFQVKLYKTYELTGDAPDSLLLKVALRTRYYD